MNEPTKPKEQDPQVRKLLAQVTALKLCVRALYHNCESAACFAMMNAENEEDEAEKIALRRQASAYSTCGGWLLAATKK